PWPTSSPGTRSADSLTRLPARKGATPRPPPSRSTRRYSILKTLGTLGTKGATMILPRVSRVLRVLRARKGATDVPDVLGGRRAGNRVPGAARYPAPHRLGGRARPYQAGG